MRKIISFLILSILLVSGNFCKKISERETLDNPALNPRQFKTFRLELAGKNYTESKLRIYIETLTHAAHLLLNKTPGKEELAKIKSRFQDMRRDKIRDYFVINYDEILTRKILGTGMLLNMKTVLKVSAVGDFLTGMGYRDLNYPLLIQAEEEIRIDDNEMRQTLNQPEDYLSPFKGKTFTLLTDIGRTSLNSQVLNHILSQINVKLNRMGLYSVSREIVDAVSGTGLSLEERTVNLSTDYIIVLSERTTITRRTLGYFSLSALLHLTLYDNRLQRINAADYQIEKILLKREQYGAEIVQAITGNMLPALLKTGSARYAPASLYKIIFVNIPDKNYAFDFLRRINPRLKFSDEVITEAGGGLSITIAFQGSFSEFREFILKRLDMEKYKNKLYLSNSQKNMLELSLKGVRVD